MATKLPSTVLRRAHPPLRTPCGAQQIRRASLLKRPHRPYTFTQLITLSDGSTYTQRSTSPAPIFRSTKDTRNHPMWQPSLDSLRNVEQDDAGRLKAFRNKFGRGWDTESVDEEGGEEGEDGEESLMDLISGGAVAGEGGKGKGSGVTEKEVEMVTVKKDGILVKVPVKKKAGGK